MPTHLRTHREHAGGTVKVGVTGTRSALTVAQDAALREVLARLAPAEIHHGDCVGADAAVHRIATELSISVVVHPPEDPVNRAWSTGARVVLAARPYLDRNRALVVSTDVLVACPWEPSGESVRSGVWATVRHARRLRRRIYVVRPDGRVEAEGAV